MITKGAAYDTNKRIAAGSERRKFYARMLLKRYLGKRNKKKYL